MSNHFDDPVSEAKNLATEKRYDESAAVFGKIFEENPGDPAALRELALVMRDLGQSQMALSLLADSTNAQTPDVETLKQIAIILRAQNRLDEAADFMVCALAHDQTNQDLFEETLLLLKQIGREAELFSNTEDTPSAQ